MGTVPQQQQHQETDTQAESNATVYEVIIPDAAIRMVCAVAAAGLLLFVVYTARSLKTKIPSSTQSYEIKGQSVEVSMEEGKTMDKELRMSVDSDQSTVCPSISDNQSEPSLSDDIDMSTPEQG